MAENRRMTAAELADELMSSEHADVVRESRLVGDLPSASQRHPPQRQTHLHPPGAIYGYGIRTVAKRARKRQRESERQAVAARTRPLEQARRAAATAAQDAQPDRPARVRIDLDSWAAFKDLAAAQRRPVADYLGQLVAAELARAHVAHDYEPAALAHRARRQLAAALANLDRSLAAKPGDGPR